MIDGASLEFSLSGLVGALGVEGGRWVLGWVVGRVVGWVLGLGPRGWSCARRERWDWRSFRAAREGDVGCRRSYARSGSVPLLLRSPLLPMPFLPRLLLLLLLLLPLRCWGFWEKGDQSGGLIGTGFQTDRGRINRDRLRGLRKGLGVGRVGAGGLWF